MSTIAFFIILGVILIVGAIGVLCCRFPKKKEPQDHYFIDRKKKNEHNIRS